MRGHGSAVVQRRAALGVCSARCVRQTEANLRGRRLGRVQLDAEHGGRTLGHAWRIAHRDGAHDEHRHARVGDVADTQIRVAEGVVGDGVVQQQHRTVGTSSDAHAVTPRGHPREVHPAHLGDRVTVQVPQRQVGGAVGVNRGLVHPLIEGHEGVLRLSSTRDIYAEAPLESWPRGVLVDVGDAGRRVAAYVCREAQGAPVGGEAQHGLEGIDLLLCERVDPDVAHLDRRVRHPAAGAGVFGHQVHDGLEVTGIGVGVGGLEIGGVDPGEGGDGVLQAVTQRVSVQISVVRQAYLCDRLS